MRTAGMAALSEDSREFTGGTGGKCTSVLERGRREDSMSMAISTEGEGWKVSSRSNDGMDLRPEIVRWEIVAVEGPSSGEGFNKGNTVS